MKGFIIWVAGTVVFFLVLSHSPNHPYAPMASIALAVVLYLKGRWDAKLDYDKKFAALEGAGYKFDVKAAGSGISFGYDSQKNEYVFIYEGGQPILISGSKLIDAELTAEVRGTDVKTTTIKFVFKNPERPTFKVQFMAKGGERAYDQLRACEAIT